VGLEYRGRKTIFCSFGCAVVQAAPACYACGAKVLGRGRMIGGRTYCDVECAEAADAKVGAASAV
jgi:hypothetical protein